MNSDAKRGRFGGGRPAAATEEELETGEPLADEAETPPPAPGKIAALRGKFGGGPPVMPKPTNPNDGQVVLASAKYLQRDPEPELRRENQKAEAKRQAEEAAANGGQSLEASVFNSGVLGGVVAMLVAVAWFLAGLADDTIYFYPPILFVIGLSAFFKGLMRNGT